MMDVYIESLITPNSFLGFEIGSKLKLSSFTIEKDYNPIGDSGSAYYFFNQDIDVEVTTRDGMIDSFDILLRNQEKEVYLGNKESNRLRLNNCNFPDFMSYLNKNELEWKFENILADKSISIAFYSKLKMLFCFDCDSKNSLSLIHISSALVSNTQRQ
ncbi:MAG: hypothetical protein J0I84_07050 [Terrimonas sp.]|nr:hypothetical protein [Terrimonas sp.]OJY79599.1 MAG: hypothetical protein BGP13_07515 [Sphingobacteriales bacterium 40-81]